MSRRLLLYMIPPALLVLSILVYLLTFSGENQSILNNDVRNYQESISAGTDSISAASMVHYFPDSTLTKTQLQGSLGSSIPSASIATVNEDGSPNIAMLSPVVISDDYIMIILSDTQTRRNLELQGIAVATAYSYTAMAAPDAQYKGSRLVLELVNDPQLIQRLRNKSETDSPYAVFLRIVRILPLG
ncbi:hypothetical protein [Spirochaeta dissipatitropha]